MIKIKLIKAVVVALSLLPSVLMAQEYVIRAADLVSYGIFESNSSGIPKPASRLAPAADEVRKVRFTEITNEIPPVLDTGFGVEYVINTRPLGRRLKVTTVIKFPEPGLILPNGRVYLESRETSETVVGEPTLHGYGFDHEYEMIPGEWVFEVWYKKARLVRKRLTVLPVPDETTESSQIE